MRLDPRRSLARILARFRRIQRRELAAFRRWIETTSNLIHLSALLLVPLLMALVTLLSNALVQLSFLLFPPLASGTYSLFADPEGQYADPMAFVAGLTAGATCGWVSLELAALTHGASTGPTAVHPESAALAVMLTGGVTWLLDVEEPSAFATALLVLLVGEAGASPFEYVVGVAVSASVVAVAFSVWRDRFYERRAQYLYASTSGDDHVLVPVRDDPAAPAADASDEAKDGAGNGAERGSEDGDGEVAAVFGARLAAAHDAGKVVLLDVVDDERRATVERDLLAGDGSVDADAVPGVDGDELTRRAATDAAERLEGIAARVRTRVGVPCEVVVAAGDPTDATLRTAAETGCDLIVAPYETDHGLLSTYVRGLFGGPTDAVALRNRRGGDRWKRILVAVSRPGDSAHAMIDFAERLAGRTGSVSLCTCIDSEVRRRAAEATLANLAETASGTVETRVARANIEQFLGANADAYDLVIIGSSGDRSAASRFVSPPTFERVQDLECDVAVFDRGNL